MDKEEATTRLLYAAEYGNVADVQSALDNAAKQQGHTGRVEGSLHFGKVDIVEPRAIANDSQQGHAGRVSEERKDKGPPQVGG